MVRFFLDNSLIHSFFFLMTAGVVENHALVFEQGSIPVLVNLFQYKDLEYNISGLPLKFNFLYYCNYLVIISNMARHILAFI